MQALNLVTPRTQIMKCLVSVMLAPCVFTLSFSGCNLQHYQKTFSWTTRSSNLMWSLFPSSDHSSGCFFFFFLCQRFGTDTGTICWLNLVPTKSGAERVSNAAINQTLAGKECCQWVQRESEPLSARGIFACSGCMCVCVCVCLCVALNVSARLYANWHLLQ